MGWRAAGACIRGRGHERDGSGCDDRVLVRHHGPLTVAALADGCGSARVGGLAARVAVERAVESVLDAGPWTDAMAAGRSALIAAGEAVAALADDLEVDRRDCGTTLMIAIASGTELVVAHVGDGVIAGRRHEEWLALSKPLGGEHANETFVITDPEMLAHARVLRFEDITACALLTDGAAASLWERSSAKVAPALQKVARALDDHDECEVENALRDRLGPELRRRTLDDCGVCVLTAEPSVRRSHDEATLTAAATSSVA